MSEQTTKLPCIGCGAEIPDVDYPAGRPEKYPNATSPGCWKIYCEDVLAREYGEWSYPPIHRLTVDAYAAQHPGTETPQTTQSVKVHLVGIYLVLYEGASVFEATDAIGTLVERHKGDFSWLEPPEHRGDVTVVDVAQADDLDEHTELVYEWARSVWNAWKEHHAVIERWARTVTER